MGEERTARVGDVLYRSATRRIRSSRSRRARWRSSTLPATRSSATAPSSFLGELNLLSGQTVFVTAVVTQPLRYVAVDRDVLRALLFEDGPLSDLVLSTFMSRREALQRVEGIGIEIVGPRSSEATMRMLDFARANRLPFTLARRVAARGEAEPAARAAPGRRRAEAPVERRRAARTRHRSRARASRGGRPARRRRRARPGSPQPSTALPRDSTRSSSRAPRSAARPARRAGSRTTSASRPGSAARSSRAARCPRRGSSAPGRPPRTALSRSSPGDGRHVVHLEEGHEIAARAVILATGADYRRLPLEDLSRLRGD